LTKSSENDSFDYLLSFIVLFGMIRF